MIKFLKYALELAYATLETTAFFASGRLIFPLKMWGIINLSLGNFFQKNKWKKN